MIKKQRINLVNDTINAINDLDKNLITDAKKAIAALKRTASKQRDYYLAFGKTWMELRKLVTPKDSNNPNTKALGQLRKKLFSDRQGNPLIDAETASYSALMYELWEAKDYPLRAYATYIRPSLNNPRPLVKDYREWVKEQKAEKYVEQVLTDGFKTDDKGNKITIKKEVLESAQRMADEGKLDIAQNMIKSNVVAPKPTKKKATPKPGKESKQKSEVKLRKKGEKSGNGAPHEIIFNPKTANSAQVMAHVAGSFNIAVEYMRKGHTAEDKVITPDQVQALLRHIEVFKAELTQYLTAGPTESVHVDDIAHAKNVKSKKSARKITTKTKKAENEGEARLNSTPRGINHFFQLFEDARKDTLRHHKKA